MQINFIKKIDLKQQDNSIYTLPLVVLKENLICTYLGNFIQLFCKFDIAF
jgi:hypothetical protein